MWNDEGVKGILVSVLEALYMRCSQATFFGGRHPDGEEERLSEKERPGRGRRREGGGDTGVCALASTWSHSALIFC